MTHSRPDPLHPLSSPAATDTQSDVEFGEVLDADQIADYEQLRRLVSPETSLELLDDFAKWLFAVAAIVGTLGASFGLSQANDLTGPGRRLFAFAVASVGVSLGFAALARLPLPMRVNRYSDVSMERYIARVVTVRGVLLFIAAVLFSFGLVLAGLSPLVA